MSGAAARGSIPPPDLMKVAGWAANMPGESDRRRTWWPAVRLWRAELKARVAGQDPQDPRTWVLDSLYHAVVHEIEAHWLRMRGQEEQALRELLQARVAILERPDVSTAWTGNRSNVRDSDYRLALHTRALANLGKALAEDLRLKERPRNG